MSAPAAPPPAPPPAGAPPLPVDVQPGRFPAVSREAAGRVGGVLTHVSSLGFSDTIVVTVSQDGRLGQWVQVRLQGLQNRLGEEDDGGILSAGPAAAATAEESQLPPCLASPRTLLGSRGDERETAAEMYAAHLAGQLALRDPRDHRTLVFGLGVRARPAGSSEGGDGGGHARAAHFDMLELLQQVI